MESSVLITGGAGFIGSSLARRLLDKDYRIVVIDSMIRGTPDNLPSDDRITIIEGDITSPTDVRRAMEAAPSFVVHLAAQHFIPYCNTHPAETVHVNVYGTQVILDEIRRSGGVDKLVFASTAAVYAPSEDKCREEEPMAPIDIYGVSKQIGEQLVDFFHRESGIASLNARIFNVIGPRETNPHLIPDILVQLPDRKQIKLGNLIPKRDYIYTDDVADGIIQMLESHITSGSFNIGTGTAYSASDVVDTINDITNWNLTIDSVPEKQRPGDRPYLCADNDRLTRLGWTCKHDFKTALKRTLEHDGLI